MASTCRYPGGCPYRDTIGGFCPSHQPPKVTLRIGRKVDGVFVPLQTEPPKLVRFNEKGFPICQETGCQVEWPTYGKEKKKPTKCEDHGKKCGMKNVMKNACHGDPKNEKICHVKYASYGFGAHISHCASCGKRHGMSDIKHHKCKSGFIDKDTGKTCIKQTCYGLEGKTPTHCSDCGKIAGLKNNKHFTCTSGFIDKRTNKRCIRQTCYGIEGESPTHCSVCGKIAGLKNNKHFTCTSGFIDKRTGETCIRQTCYGIEGESPTHCSTCGRIAGLKDNKHLKCLTCDTQVSSTTRERFKSYCFSCYREKHPNELHVYNHCIKEKDVKKYIERVCVSSIVLSIISGERIYCGTRYYTPDIIIRCVGFIIIIEIDEHQHRDYDKFEEVKRMQDIANSLECDSIVFIRFNPDSYTKDGIRHPSCWKADGKGVMVVHDESAWNDRLTELQKMIQKHIDNKTPGCICEYLYYDESDDE